MFEKIKKVDWKYLVNRREALLFRSITDNSYEFFKEDSGIDFSTANIIRLGIGEVFHDNKDLKFLHSYFIKVGVKGMTVFKDKLIKNVSVMKKKAQEISKTNYSKSSDEEIAKEVKDYFIKSLHAQDFLLPMPVAGNVLSELILNHLPKADDKKKREWLAILTFPEKENSHVYEERSFCELVKAKMNNDPLMDKKIDKHLKEFAWIGARGYNFSFAWDKKIIMNRINNFLKQKKDPDKEKEHIEEVRQEGIKAANDLTQELGLSEIKDLLELAREYVYLRTWRTDMMYSSGYQVMNLLVELVKRNDMNVEDIPFYAYFELIDIAEKKLNPKDVEIEKRKQDYVLVRLDNKYYVSVDKELINSIDNWLVAKGDEDSIKGNIAYKGKVKGKAKVVQQGDDISKVENGDILIAVMTFPNFVPAMEKAAAFVTDEGGILCHAAIVSREMKKPCIIATRKATKIFKDGDMIEVDANKGIVRKIK